MARYLSSDEIRKATDKAIAESCEYYSKHRKKKSFKFEDSARDFAKKVNGTVRLRQLPDYNGVIVDWVVEWEV